MAKQHPKGPIALALACLLALAPPAQAATTRPTAQPSARPSTSARPAPSARPVARPSLRPTARPSVRPGTPAARPSGGPSPRPSAAPSVRPTLAPLTRPPAPPAPTPTPAPRAESPQEQDQARAWVEGAFFREQAEAVVQEAETAALRDGPNQGPARWAALGVAYAKQGRWKDADAALARAPQSGQVGPIARALVAWYRGEWAKAEGLCSAILAVDGGDEVARWGLASALVHQERAAATDAALAPLLAHEERLSDFLRPWVVVVQGASLALKAQKAPPWEQLRLVPEVKGLFQKALILAPHGPNALSAMGRFQLLAPFPFGDRKEGLRLIAQADAIDPFFYLNAVHLVMAHLALNDVRQARIEAVRYQARFEGCPTAMLELAPLRSQLGVLPL